MNDATGRMGVMALALIGIATVSCDSTAAKEPRTVTVAEADRVFVQPGVSELAQAVADGDVPRIKALAPKTDLSARGDQDVTLLEWAIWQQKPQSLAALLEAGADPAQIGMDQETVAHMAAMVDDPEYMAVLVSHDAPVDIPSPASGRTPVFKAVQSQRAAQLDMLLAAGADPRRIDATGNSLLHVVGNDADVTLRLLELGVDPAHRNAQQVTFQPYFFMTPDRIVNQKTRDGRGRVRAWLSRSGIPLESR